MRKFSIALLMILTLPACQQKQEEQKAQAPQFPSVPQQALNEIPRLQEEANKSPKDPEAWAKLGNVLMDASRFNEAAHAYRKALELNPDNVDVRVDMGTCYRRDGHPNQAVDEYRKALKINPEHLNAHKNLGVVLGFDLKKKDEAIKEFKKSLELAPDAPDAGRIKDAIREIKAR